MIPTMCTYFPSLEIDIFLNIAHKHAQRGIFWNVVEQSFIFRLNVDFHQPRTQYALRTIDHTTLYVNQNSVIVLNTFWRTSARSAEVLLTTAPILLTNFVLNQSPRKRLWRSTNFVLNQRPIKRLWRFRSDTADNEPAKNLHNFATKD